MFFRRSPRQSTPQTVQGEQADSASTSMPALELESVSVFTELPEGGHRRILKSVSLRFTAKRTAVLGLNGSGKSTLLGLFNGLTPPDEGIVRVNGVDTLQAPRRRALSRAWGCSSLSQRRSSSCPPSQKILT